MSTLLELERIGTLVQEGICSECGHGDGILSLKGNVTLSLLTIVNDIVERGVHYDNIKGKTKFDARPRALPTTGFLDRHLSGGNNGERHTGRQGLDGDTEPVRQVRLDFGEDDSACDVPSG